MPQVYLKFFEHPVERTEEEIAELKADGLLREDPPKADPPPPSGGKDKKE